MGLDRVHAAARPLFNQRIAKCTGLARNTIKVWLKADSIKEPRYRRQPNKAGKRSAFEATLLACLKADALRLKAGRRTAKALFIQIQAQGYEGG